MPNTKVNLRSALVGGLSGGIMWATLGIVFATFLANSARTQAIYASFAIAITTLIWLYLNWLILLIGSQIAFYFQNPAYLRIGRREPRLSNAMRERVALNIMFLIGKEFRNPVSGVSLRSLSRTLRIPSITLSPIAIGLEAAGLLTSNDKEELLPGREMSRVTLHDILDVVRRDGETGSHEDPSWDDEIKALGQGLDDAIAATLSEQTLADLLNQSEN
jgi:membrane protein